MIRLFAVCFAIIWMIGCQCQPRTPVYDPFAAASQRIPPPPTGALNQPSGYYQAPQYQQPVYPQYQPPNYPPGGTYQAPAFQVPSLPPPGYVPVPTTSSIPATLTPVSHYGRISNDSFASSRNVPTPKPRPDWPSRRQLQPSDELSWIPPNIPGGIRQASAEVPLNSNVRPIPSMSTLSPSTLSPSTLSTVQPTTYWESGCDNCDPYNTPHIANPLLPMPMVYDEAYPTRSPVTYSANQSYGSDQWRRRSNQ